MRTHKHTETDGRSTRSDMIYGVIVCLLNEQRVMLAWYVLTPSSPHVLRRGI